VEAVNLVNEEDVTVLQVRQQRGEVASPRQHRSRRDPQTSAHFGGDDACQRRFAQSGRSSEKKVIHRLAALAGRLEHDPEMLDELRLAYELGQRTGSEPDFFQLFVVVGRDGIDDALPRGDVVTF
jgi:hypothetical protein